MSATPTAAGGGACAVAAVPPSLLIIDGVGLPLAGPARAMQDQGSDQSGQGRNTAACCTAEGLGENRGGGGVLAESGTGHL